MLKHPRKETSALVLASNPYGEDSARITLAGSDGVFSRMANRIYKPNSPLRPLLMVGSRVSVSYHEVSENLKSASSLKVMEDSSPLWTDRKTISFLMFLSELSIRLYHYGDVFPVEDVKRILSSLEKGGDLLSNSLLILGAIYKSLGLKRNVQECVSCGKKEHICSYSFSEGGFLCNECLKKETQPTSLPPEMDLFVLKFCFLPLTDTLRNKKVPFENGMRILSQRTSYLTEYFDLKPLQTFALFQSSLED